MSSFELLYFNYHQNFIQIHPSVRDEEKHNFSMNLKKDPNRSPVFGGLKTQITQSLTQITQALTQITQSSYLNRSVDKLFYQRD